MFTGLFTFLLLSLTPALGLQLQKKTDLLERRLESPVQVNAAARNVLEQIERGLRRGSVESLYPLLSSQVSVSIEGGESGMFSNNQVVALLKNYFSQRKPIAFSFSRVNDHPSNPYATGTLVYAHRGVQQTAQVYVSLVQRESMWVVTQFNIYE